MIVKKEIEIDLPDGLAERAIAFRAVKPGDKFVNSLGKEDSLEGVHVADCPRLILAPPRETLVTRIARAVIRRECGFTPVMERIEWRQDHWNTMCGRNDWWSGELCGPIPPHEPGDPETVLVAEIDAEVERLRKGGGV